MSHIRQVYKLVKCSIYRSVDYVLTEGDLREN